MTFRLWLLLGAVLATASGDDQLIEKITIEVTPGRNATDDWSWQLRQEQAAGIPPLQGLKVDAARYDSVHDGIAYEALVLQVTAQRQKKSSLLDYTYFPGVGYYKLHTAKRNWFEAKAICETEDAHLVVINSEEEAAALRELRARYPNIEPHILIGFNDLEEEGRYVTIFGQTLQEAGYAKWAPDQPDNHGGIENCGTINPEVGLNDGSCTLRKEFICEFPQN